MAAEDAGAQNLIFRTTLAQILASTATRVAEHTASLSRVHATKTTPRHSIGLQRQVDAAEGRCAARVELHAAAAASPDAAACADAGAHGATCSLL